MLQTVSAEINFNLIEFSTNTTKTLKSTLISSTTRVAINININPFALHVTFLYPLKTSKFNTIF